MLVTVLAALCALMTAVPAFAEAGWQLPASQLAPTLTEPESFAPPVAAVGAGGEASVALVSWHPPASHLVTIERPAGGSWQAPQAMPGSAEAFSPAIAMTASGEQTVAWQDGASPGDPRSVWVARRSGDEAWRDVGELPFYEPGAVLSDGPSVAEDAAGDAVAVWVESNSEYSSSWLVASVRRGGTWGAPQRIAAPAEFIQLSEHSVVAAGHGEFVVAWTEGGSEIYDVDAETLSGEGWSGQQTVEAGPGYPWGVSLSADSSGDAAMVWSNASDEAVHAASLRSGSWTVSDPPGAHTHVVCWAHAPNVGIDAAGDAQALWLESDGRLTSESMSPGGSWRGDRQVLATIPESEYVVNLQIGLDSGGDALASWSALTGNSPPASEVQGTSKPAGGVWQTPVTFDASVKGWRSPVSLAAGQDGDGVLAWLDEIEPGSTWEENEFTPRASLFQAPPAGGGATQAPGPGSAAAAPASARPRLGAVYLLAPKSHLWLGHGRHRLTVPVRNTNPFPVSGTVRLYEYLIPTAGRAHLAALAVSGVARYRLGAHETRRVAVRLNRRALRRLRAYVPDRGHILVDARLAIAGEGQSASSSVVLALDQPMRRHPMRKPRVPPGYPAPVDPWAHKSC